MGTGTRRALGIGIAVLAVLGALWVLRPEGGGGPTTRLEDSAADDAAPGPEVGVPARPEALLTGPPAPGVAEEPAEASPFAGPLLLDPAFGRPVRFDGRVLDPAGRPVPGARVLYQPDGWTLEAGSLPLVPGRVDAEQTAVTVTDEAGRFLLEARHVPGRAGELSPTRYMNPLDFPELHVHAQGFAAQAHVCRGFRGGDWSAGDIVLVPASTVTGRVVDELGSPLPDVSLEVHFGFRAEWATASHDVSQRGHAASFLDGRTGPDGRFALDHLGAGGGRIGFRLAGRVPVDSEHFELGEADTHDLGTIVLARGGMLAGQVRDVDGRPLPGATVFAHGHGLGQSDVGDDPILNLVGDADRRPDRLVTDADGRFVIRGLEGPNQTLYAILGGYEPVQLRDQATGRADLVVTLRRQALLDVTVVDAATGAPVPDARVRAFRVSGIAYWEDVELEVAPGPAPGTHRVARPGTRATRLLVEADGFGDARELAPGVTAPATGAHRVSLGPEAVLAGAVLGADGAPVAGATVSLSAGRASERDANARAPWERVTDDAGRFRFTGLPALDGRIAVRDADGRHVPIEGRPLALAAGERREDLRLVLAPAARVRGVILRPDGTPDAGGGAALWRRATAGADPFASFHTLAADREGRFELGGLLAGDYHVQCDPGGLLDFGLATGEERELVIQQRAAPELVGRVTDHLGAPIEGVLLRAVSHVVMNGEPRELMTNAARTDARGDYEVETGGPGEVEVRAWAPGGARQSRPARLDWNQREVVDLRFPGGRITGSVVDHEGRPVAGARVHVAWTSRRPESGADGRFVLEHLAPGEYTVTAQAEPYLGASVDVILPESGLLEDVVLRLEPGARLVGTAHAPNGTPIRDGTFVNLLDAEGRRRGREELEDGAFVLEGLRAGSYELVIGNLAQAEHFGDEEAWIHWRGGVELGPGEDKRMEIVTDR